MTSVLLVSSGVTVSHRQSYVLLFCTYRRPSGAERESCNCSALFFIILHTTPPRSFHMKSDQKYSNSCCELLVTLERNHQLRDDFKYQKRLYRPCSEHGLYCMHRDPTAEGTRDWRQLDRCTSSSVAIRRCQRRDNACQATGRKSDCESDKNNGVVGDYDDSVPGLAKKQSNFDENEFVSNFMKHKRSGTKCFQPNCYRKLKYGQVKSQSMPLGYFKQLKAAEKKNIVHRILS